MNAPFNIYLELIAFKRWDFFSVPHLFLRSTSYQMTLALAAMRAFDKELSVTLNIQDPPPPKKKICKDGKRIKI